MLGREELAVSSSRQQARSAARAAGAAAAPQRARPPRARPLRCSHDSQGGGAAQNRGLPRGVSPLRSTSAARALAVRCRPAHASSGDRGGSSSSSSGNGSSSSSSSSSSGNGNGSSSPQSSSSSSSSAGTATQSDKVGSNAPRAQPDAAKGTAGVGGNGAPPGDGAPAEASPTAAPATVAAAAEAVAPAPVARRSSWLDPLDREILGIALPMLATLAAEPCAALVDTAFMGRLGAAQLAGVGVALSVYNTVAKLVQVPLLSIATTNVAAARGAALAAEADAAKRREEGCGGGGGGNGPATGGVGGGGGGAGPREAEAVSAAASAALLVAAAVGVAVGALLAAGAPVLADVWGIGPGSPLRGPALDFLTLRALGAPVSTVLLVGQARRQGRALDYYLIFVVGLGVRGAAVATVLAQQAGQ
ncbi:hypothetical protein Rsub_01135 [Raphidocelis subcapitata]|uniref:Multidrug and toxic compound extrusion protein n=1 Tax=Raphidocelis subcapitata TaxID=307507 RepID=A0A2V0NSA5_9CHLO|nr:hypothetical protein Rsub_01135 [Raphidocelis subcapitata]|eukprot:GBF88423.1 hypothetical protein Rsub_01135 [Raphidocelis subcapitata]